MFRFKTTIIGERGIAKLFFKEIFQLTILTIITLAKHKRHAP